MGDKPRTGVNTSRSQARAKDCLGRAFETIVNTSFCSRYQKRGRLNFQGKSVSLMLYLGSHNESARPLIQAPTFSPELPPIGRDTPIIRRWSLGHLLEDQVLQI